MRRTIVIQSLRLAILAGLLGAAGCSSTSTTILPTIAHTPRPGSNNGQPVVGVNSTAIRSPEPTLGPVMATALAAVPTAAPTATQPPIPTIVEKGKLPPGFSLIVYAKVERPTRLAFGPDKRLYAAAFNGKIYRLTDADGDHRAEKVETFASGFDTPLGLLWLDQNLLVSSKGLVTQISDSDGDGVAETRHTLLSGLPNGRHQNDGLVLGADGWVYMGLGSTCDACKESDFRSGTIVRFHADGSGLEVFARGLRNPYGLAFFPGTGDLFATDNGRDDLGDHQPPEELNLIVQNGDYGWPLCWGYGQGPNCTGRISPITTFPARSSADGLTFYTGSNFPDEYQNNLFVALFGSYVTQVQAGLDRVQLYKDKGHYIAQITPFLTGVGRPLDVITGPDGALYIADYDAGQVYRVSYGMP